VTPSWNSTLSSTARKGRSGIGAPAKSARTRSLGSASPCTAGSRAGCTRLHHSVQRKDLGHPLCGRLRGGTWAFDYISSDLSLQADKLSNLCVPTKRFQERFKRVKTSAVPLRRPKSLAIIISSAYEAARLSAIEASNFVLSGHSFTHDLALCSVQMHGMVPVLLYPDKMTPSLAVSLSNFTKYTGFSARPAEKSRGSAATNPNESVNNVGWDGNSRSHHIAIGGHLRPPSQMYV
jgi:hypothetical protein